MRELLKKIIRSYCPNIPFIRKQFTKIKIKQINRYQLNIKDIEKGEANNYKKYEIVKRYAKKWKAYAEKIEMQFFQYVQVDDTLNHREDLETLKINVLFDCFAYGFAPDEFFIFELEGKNSEEKRKYISERERLNYSYSMNDIIDMEIFFDKWKTYQFYKDFYRREVICIRDGADRKKFNDFIKKYSIFVKKEVFLSRGRGIEKIDMNKNIQSVDTVFQHILDSGNCVLEEVIKQKTELAVFHPASVNTVRCVAIRTMNKIHIPYCILRMGKGESFIDNSSSGGIFAVLDSKTGIICSDGMDEKNNLYRKHPDSEIIFKGYQLPEWNELLELIDIIMKKNNGINYVGWDFAYSNEGWIIVEGNCTPQLGARQVACGGMKAEFDEILGMLM